MNNIPYTHVTSSPLLACKQVTISNDGATIMKLLDIAHPAAKVLVDVSVSQDAEVGDGTTSVVLLSAEVLKHIKGFVEEGVNPQVSTDTSKYLIMVSMSNICIVQPLWVQVYFGGSLHFADR